MTAWRDCGGTWPPIRSLLDRIATSRRATRRVDTILRSYRQGGRVWGDAGTRPCAARLRPRLSVPAGTMCAWPKTSSWATTASSAQRTRGAATRHALVLVTAAKGVTVNARRGSARSAGMTGINDVLLSVATAGWEARPRRPGAIVQATGVAGEPVPPAGRGSSSASHAEPVFPNNDEAGVCGHVDRWAGSQSAARRCGAPGRHLGVPPNLAWLMDTATTWTTSCPCSSPPAIPSAFARLTAGISRGPCLCKTRLGRGVSSG